MSVGLASLKPGYRYEFGEFLGPFIDTLGPSTTRFTNVKDEIQDRVTQSDFLHSWRNQNLLCSTPAANPATCAVAWSASAHFKVHRLCCSINVRIVVFVHARGERVRVDWVFRSQPVPHFDRSARRN
jgi:hypothetical protein